MSEASKSALTRRRLLVAAEDLFSEKSFDAVSVRAIAREAGVDAALINHYFGSKEGLFREVLERLVQPDVAEADLQQQPSSTWGHELVSYADSMWSSRQGKAMLAVFRRGIAGHPEVLRGAVTTMILNRIIAHLEGDDRELRASLAASQMAGLIVARHVVKVEPLASISTDELAALVGPTIQRYLTGDL